MYRQMNRALFSLAIAASLLTPACGGSTEEQTQEHLQNGDRLVAEGKHREATVEYRNAVKQDERSGEARLKLGQAYERLGEPAARGELVRAADLLPDSVDAQVAAARALLRAGEFEDARARAESALKLDPKSAEAHLVRGRAAAGLRDLDGALEAFQEGLSADPGGSDLHVSIGAVQARQGQQKEAEASFRQAIAVAPRSIPARLAFANFLWATQRTEETEKALLETVAIDQNDFTANRALARFYTLTNRPDMAEAPLRRAADNSSEPQPKLQLADYYAGRGRNADALAILQKLSGDPTAFAAATGRRAAIDYQEGRRKEAYALLDQVMQKEPANLQVMVLKGKWQLIEGQTDAAFATASEAVKKNPESPAAQELLGAVQIARQQTDEAIKAFTEMLRLQPRSSRANVALANLNVARGDSAAGLKFAEDAVRLAPLSGPARYALVNALLAERNLPRASTEIQPLVAGSPKSALVQTLLGRIEEARGNVTAARAAFTRALEIDPRAVEAVAALAGIDSYTKGQQAQAASRAAEYVQKYPDSAQGHYVAARVSARNGQLAEAETSVRKAISLDPGYMEAYQLLARLFIQQNRLADAQREYERLIQQRPNDVAAHTMVALLLQAQQKEAEAEKAYENILRIDPRAVLANNNLAYINADRGTNLDRALNLAQTAKTARPDDPDVNDTLGWVLYKRNLHSAAIDAFQKAVAKDPQNATYQYHLGMAYLANKDPQRARAALDQALKLNLTGKEEADARAALATLRS